MHANLIATRRGTSVLFVALLLLAAFAVACGGDEPAPAPAATSTSAGTDATSTLPTYDASNPRTTTPTPSTPAAAGSGTPLEGPVGGGASRGETIDLSALPQELQQAVTQTREIETVEFEMNVAMSGIPELPDGASFDMQGAIDAEAGRMRMRMDLSQIFGAAMAAEGAETDEMTAALLEAFLGDGVMEMVFADGITYVRWPLITAFAGVDTEWVGMPTPPGEDPFAGVGDLSGLGGAGFADPAAVLDSLGGAGSLEVVGTEAIRGVTTTRYDGVIDTNAALATLSDAELAELEGEFGPDLENFPTMPISLWVGDDGLIRRIQMQLDFADLLGAAAATVDAPESMTMTLDYFGFGDDVSIETPPADQVTIIDEDDLFGGFGAGAGGGFGGTY